MIQNLGGGGTYRNAKLEILRRVNEINGKATIRVSIPSPLFWIAETAFEELLNCCICDPEIGGGVEATYYNAMSHILRHRRFITHFYRWIQVTEATPTPRSFLQINRWELYNHCYEHAYLTWCLGYILLDFVVLHGISSLKQTTQCRNGMKETLVLQREDSNNRSWFDV